ncbi:MAG TPA: hypothetical protein VMH86_13310 [Rhizomicrobium sp.]|nr:hypothetical protein [Rhizomicrobium sp.]
MSADAVPVKGAGKTYIIECAIVSALYAGLAWARHWLIAQAPNHALAIAASIVPSLPIWALFFVVWRYYRRIDEFEQQRFLETIALSFGIGSCLLVTFAFLTDAGLAWLDITWAWPTLAVSWALTSGIMHVARR